MNSKNSYSWVFWMTVCLVLLLVHSNLVVASDCPRGCDRCNESDGYSVNNIRLVKAACRGNRWMTEIPADLPRVVRTLLLSSNEVKIIKTSSFEPYKYLKSLDLTSNKIENIENGSFRYQKYLVNLDLKKNQLTRLTPEMFFGLHSLKNLDLEKNRIASLSKGVFSSLTNLTFLDLHDNEIANIERGAFDSMDYLEEIVMSGCRLKKLQAGSFGNLMSLRTIDLSSNMIESIDPETFSCSPLVETLHLNDNDLKYVPVIVLSKLRLLKDLDLSKNALMSIRSKAFIHNENLEILNLGFCHLGFLQEGAFDGPTKLRKVFLNGNPFDCDCRMSWLLRFWKEAESKNIFQEPRRINCSSPRELSGKTMMDLSSTDLKCNCTTCTQDGLCNGVNSTCVPCIQGGVVESCNCSPPILCHSYDGSCLCSHVVHKPTTWNCSYNMTNQTCDRNAKLAVVDRKTISCLCEKGFRGDGFECADIDECAETTNQCRLVQKLCRNTYGSYECYCNSGYKATKIGCEDINECDKKPCLGPSICHNTPGSYSCKCKTGHADILSVCRPLPNSVNITVQDIEATSVMVRWSIRDNRDTVSFITIQYRRFGTSSSEWLSAPDTYTPNTTQAVVKNLTPDTFYTIRVKLNLIYNTSTPLVISNVESFQTKELPTKGKSSGSGENKGVVIVTSSVVGSAVAIAIALSLVAFFLKRKKPNTGEEGTDTMNRPYLQDLVEMRMFSGEGNHESTKACSRIMDVWEVPRDRLKVGEKIGEGQFGIVLKGTLTTSEGPVKVAIKTIKGVDRFDMKDFMQEMDMMKEIGHHPNVVSLLGVSSIGAPLYIITEYVDGGNLLDLLRSSRRTDDRYRNMTSTLNSRQLLRIALDVSKGMSHIALMKLVHRDLAARNVLMTTDLVAKIADFGLARDVYCEGMYVKTGAGRLPIKWMAPDAIRDQTYTIKSDVWSFGILLWEIVTLGGSPYPGIPVNILLEKLLSGYRMPKPEHCAQEVYTIMEDCWALDPSTRPSFDDVCEALSLLLAEEGHIYINIRAIEAEQMGAGSSGSKDEDNAL